MTRLKLMHVGWHLLRGWIQARWFLPTPVADRQRCIQRWAATLLKLLGVQVRTTGQPSATSPVMVVMNHLSWLDIVVLLAIDGSWRFVAKADTRAWPLIGRLTQTARTLYVARESRRDALRVVGELTQTLQARADSRFVVFPEGTTSDGSTVLPFHPNLLQAAIDSGAPVQPAALRYTDCDGRRCRNACYIDQDNLLGSIRRVVNAGGLVAQLHWGAEQGSAGRHRRAWAVALHDEVQGLCTERADIGTC